ncbi:MAG: hypothetical protein M1836_007370 [Candelina mexicana]|nr:MAG: hypothetical protein M1836_007370 [Candelina mexicana]
MVLVLSEAVHTSIPIKLVTTGTIAYQRHQLDYYIIIPNAIGVAIKYLPSKQDVWNLPQNIRINRAPLTAAEVIQHPEFRHVTWDLPATEKGKVAVGHSRGGPFNIAYELHGRGPIHLLVVHLWMREAIGLTVLWFLTDGAKWIMGLAAFKTAWQRQTKDFGHEQASKYTSLIFDNRGMGESDKPLMRYSSSELAKDTLELLNQLEWVKERSLHVIGVSMGGMIAQELGFFENLRTRMNMFIPKPIDVQLANTKATLFSQAWADAPDAEPIVGGFPTNGDRFAGQELKKRQDKEGFTRKGFLLQVICAGWHYKGTEQLKQLGDQVGRERIQIIHGALDRMITVAHAEVLDRELGRENNGITKTIFEDAGHYLPMEKRNEFRALIEAMVEKTEALNKNEEQ